MIDFRYHLVSIVAVFLALAIGIVLGTTTLNGQVIQRVKNVAETLTHENEKLRGEVGSLRQQVEADQQLVRELAPALLTGKLLGERIVIVEAPGAGAELRRETVDTLTDAGATVGGRVSVRPKYLEKGEASVLGELAARLKPSDMKLPEGSPYERSAAVLAAALMGDGSTSDKTGAVENAGSIRESSDKRGSEQADAATTVSSFQTGGYLTTSEDPSGRATLAVVIPPSTPFAEDKAERRSRALLALAKALDKRGGGAVVAGATTSVEEGGFVRALRNSAAAETVSTVDFAHTATGRVATVVALRKEDQGKTGHYGIGAGASSYLPTMSPSPDSTDPAEQ